MKLSGLFSIVAFGCLKSAAALRGAPPRSLQEPPDLCASIIAIALTRDPSDPTQARHLSSDSDEEFVCERADTGEFLPLVGTAEQIDQLRDSLNYGEFVSAETTIVGLTEANLVIVEVPGTGGGNAFTGDSNGTAVVEEAVSLPLGALEFKPGYGQHSLRRLAAAGAEDQSRRHLATYLGDKKVLFVKVTDVNGLAHPDVAATISDKIFGTNGDTTTMTSQFSACSFGKMTVSNDRVNLGNKAAAPGVIEVTIDISLVDSGRNAIKSAAVRAAEAKLGYSLPGPFDHVMFGLEKCYVECGWAAYGGVNSWFTVYAGNNYKYPAVAMHEFGHNLNLAHSGDGVAEYKDHSCLMGNPWFRDDVSQMCFNPAKNYQIGAWYSDKIDFWNSGNTGSNRIVKKIIGIADYGNNPQSRPVVVKLESGTENDLFIGFNRKQGINSASKLGNDLVTVIEQGRDGNGYSKSVFLSGLDAGQSYTKSNWQGSGKNMVISVIRIDSSSNPWTADVEFNFNNDPGTPPPPTPNPAPLPTTAQPTNNPTSNPTTKCGNGICDANENSIVCAVDCSGLGLGGAPEAPNGAEGIMFRVKAVRHLTVTSFDVYGASSGVSAFQVYTRSGNYNGHESNQDGWTLSYNTTSLQLNGRYTLASLGRFSEGISIPAGTEKSFYLYTPGKLMYAPGSGTSPSSRNGDLELYEGTGVYGGIFANNVAPRVFAGMIRYDVSAASPPTTASPVTASPTSKPSNAPSTASPVTASPTKSPSRKPTSQPTNAPSRKPTSQPTNAPSKKPTVQPSKAPTKKPTVQPTNAPSKKPTITSLPTKAPTKKPTAKPTVQPSKAPTKKPTVQPSKVPTKKPTVQPTNAPTRKPTNNLCGNNICEGNEDSSTCSSDCQGIKLPANSVGAKGADGAMFYVKARGRDISIRSFDIFTSFEAPANTINSVVQVYTRPGQFRGYEGSVDGWRLVYNDSSIDLLGQNSPTSLGGIDEEVIIPANQYQSFLIYTPGSGKVMYSGGTSEGTRFSNDAALEFYEGVGMVGFFSGSVTDIYSPRVFRGAIQYDIITIPATCGNTICEENESTAVCPSDCRNLAFQTNDIAANGADGAMFTIKALRDIKITSLDFFGGSTTTDLVQVFTRQGSYIGHELSSNSWNLVYSNSTVEIKGRYDPTSLGNFDTEVFITKNSVQSFYVYSPPKVMYSPGTTTTSEGYLFKYNDAIAFYEGIGVNGQFATATLNTLYRPRVWRGNIRYNVV